MAPFPAEIDVYTIPHARMKQLVNCYIKQSRSTDFCDKSSLQSFLETLLGIFTEFKNHEQIENEIIVQKLKARLTEYSIHDARVCSCHDNCKLVEILEMVTVGRVRHDWTSDEMMTFTKRLKEVLFACTDEFLSHMQEEEEIFQPLLMKYFKYEELKRINAQVLQRHRLQPTLKKGCEQRVDCIQIADSISHLSVSNEYSISEAQVDHFDSLPNEILLIIFEKLDWKSLSKCLMVCKRFHRVIFESPVLWKIINLREMSKEFGYILETCFDEAFLEAYLLKTCDHSYQNPLELAANDVEQVFDAYDNYICKSAFHPEKLFYLSVTKCLFPTVGANISSLTFSRSPILDGHDLGCILKLCPNLKYLNLSFTRASRRTFQNVALNHLENLNLESCMDICDGAVKLIADAITVNRVKCCSALNLLSFNGCLKITDSSLLYMAKSGALSSTKHFNLSGCHNLTGRGLTSVLSFMPNIDPTYFSYCDQIFDGPLQQTADGCQNIHSFDAFCCRSSDDCLRGMLH